MAGTEGQGGELWFQLGRPRITASNLKDMAYYPRRCTQQLWKEETTLENVKSIIWGKKHESVAREEYEKLHNCHVKEVDIPQ